MATQKEVFQAALAHFHTQAAQQIESLMQRYQEPVVNETLLPPQVAATVHALRAENPGVFSKEELSLLLAREWEWLQMRYVAGKRDASLFQREARSGQNVGCPFCDAAHSLSHIPQTRKKRMVCGQCDIAFDSDLPGA